MAINFLERMKINSIWNLYLTNLVIQAAVSNGPGPDVQHQVWAAVPARHREEMRHCHRDCQRTGRWTQMLIVVMWCSNVDCMCFQKCEQVNEQKCSTTSEPQCTTVQEQICTPLQVDCFFFQRQQLWRADVLTYPNCRTESARQSTSRNATRWTVKSARQSTTRSWNSSAPQLASRSVKRRQRRSSDDNVDGHGNDSNGYGGMIISPLSPLSPLGHGRPTAGMA